MRIIIRTYKSGRIVWWVLSKDRFPLGCGPARSRQHAYCTARSWADQYAAEVRDGFSLFN